MRCDRNMWVAGIYEISVLVEFLVNPVRPYSCISISLILFFSPSLEGFQIPSSCIAETLTLRAHLYTLRAL